MLARVHSRGRPLIFYGGVFGGEAERVPAHGVQHVVAAHPHITREGVADRVVADMADVERAAGIGQHLQHVVFGLGGVLLGFIEGIVLPAFVPFQFDLVVVVSLFGHFRLFGWKLPVSQTVVGVCRDGSEIIDS